MQLSYEGHSDLLRCLAKRGLVGMAVCTVKLVDVSGRLEPGSNCGAGILAITVTYCSLRAYTVYSFPTSGNIIDFDDFRLFNNPPGRLQKLCPFFASAEAETRW